MLNPAENGSDCLKSKDFRRCNLNFPFFARILQETDPITSDTAFCKTLCGSAKLAAAPAIFCLDHRQMHVEGISCQNQHRVMSYGCIE